MHAEVYDHFASWLAKRVQGFKVGAPKAEGTNIGPLVNDRGVAKTDDTSPTPSRAGRRCSVMAPGYSGMAIAVFLQPTVPVNVAKDSGVAYKTLSDLRTSLRTRTTCSNE